MRWPPKGCVGRLRGRQSMRSGARDNEAASAEKWRQRLFAWLLSHAAPAHDRAVATWKERLFSGLSGTILEIGPGTGVNLSYYPEGIDWIGIDPNPFMHAYLRSEAQRLGVKADLRQAAAEQIPLPDNSSDAVVSTLVLCSVRDPQTALNEICRVLKPGGRLLFIEHVAAPQGTWRRRLQSGIRPVWRALADGCCPDRETIQAIRDAGFDQLDYVEFELPMLMFSPHVAGQAQKRQ